MISWLQEGSFDAFMSQTLERKAGFVRAVLVGGESSVRTVEDISEEMALGYAELKALSLGDPRALELAGAESERSRLGRLERRHRSDQSSLRRVLADAEHRIPKLEVAITIAQAAAAKYAPTTGEDFSATVGDRSTSSRSLAAEWLSPRLMPSLNIHMRAGTERDLGALLVVGGQEIQAKVVRPTWQEPPAVELRAGVPHAPAVSTPVRGVLSSMVTAVKAAERAAAQVASLPGDLEDRLDTARRAVAAAQPEIGKAFAHAEKLEAVKQQIEELTASLKPDPPPVETGSLAADPLTTPPQTSAASIPPTRRTR